MVYVNQSILEASICQDSFYDFVQRFWDQIIPEKPIWNWHIKYLCDELQQMAERVFKRQPKEYDLIINISPGSTKSTICSVMFPAWLWTVDPTICSICGSYGYPLSLYLATKSLDVMRSDKYKKLFPNVLFKKSKMEEMSNTMQGMRIATSTGGAITGKHGHFIIVDDPISPKDITSKVTMDSANRWIDQTLLTRMVDRSITPVILIMQRLHQNDPTQHLLDKPEHGKIRHICLPAVITPKVKPRRLRGDYKYSEDIVEKAEKFCFETFSQTKEEYCFEKDINFERGQFVDLMIHHGFFADRHMDPKRLPFDVLCQAKADLGEFGYSGQFLQDPIPLGGGLFKVSRITIDIPPNKMKQRVRYWDKAGTADGGAYTVGALITEDLHKRIWILDIVRGRWDAHEREQIILNTARMDGRHVVVGIEQEPGSGGKESAQNTVRHLAGFRIRVDIPRGNKLQRALPLADALNGRNVYMVKASW
ncbi:hypothetical protein LCGC14_2305360, partial [marine sediment metagenome]